jgi:hypothetical protein
MSKLNVIGFAAGALALCASTGAFAAPVVLSDTYWGGTPNDSGVNEVIGGPAYAISGLTAERVGNDLNVVINTNYANNIGAGGTLIGSLFIGDPAKLNYNGAGAGPQFRNDTYSADTDRFGYVFDFDVANNTITGGTGTGSLFSLNGNGTDVQRSFGSIFRADQAIDRTGGVDTGVYGNWTIGSGSVSFNISNFFGLAGVPSTALTLAWAMSCANDVILGVVELPKNTNDVPLPAGVLLLLSGLAGMGALGRSRKKA